jgi:hypothetical protein
MSTNKTRKNVFFESAKSASVDVESPDFLVTKKKDRELFIPTIDFTTASNFIRFGSAEEYYAESIKRIYTSYPYDGSAKEKVQFDLSSSYLDRWMFKNKYPKSTGYLHFDYDAHVVINRGYKSATTPSTTKLSKLFESKVVINDPDKRRKQTFVFDFNDGVTFEWMMKKNGWDNEKETIFELTSSQFQLKMLLSSSNSPFWLYAQSGSATIALTSLASAAIVSSSVSDSNWHHYALSVYKTGSNIGTNFYIDGVSNNIMSSHTNLGNIDELTTMYIASGSHGLLSASVDEFKYWNKKQNSSLIYNNYQGTINGGANSDDYRTELGMYFKFNEGLTTTTATDRIVLDYSGRISNGYIENYNSTVRSTGSSLTNEVGDPIVRSSHPLIVTLQAEMQASGSEYDTQNTMSLYDLVPKWMREKDEEDNSDLKKLVQIMASYFDTLYAQIESLPNLKQKTYVKDGDKPLPFANRLLEERGMKTSDILINSDILEFFNDRDANGNLYTKSLPEIKNLIYTNIYNNLENIYKSKGTEKAYRNLIRCFGIDDELLKLNLYTDRAKHYLTDKKVHTSEKTKHVDFANPSRFGSTVYQQNVISGSKEQKLEKTLALTAEVEVMIPSLPSPNDPGYYRPNFLSSSVFGIDAAATTGTEYSSSAVENNFQLYLVRDDFGSDRAKWVLEQTKVSTGTTNVILTSSYYDEIYNNQRWNLAVRIYPNGYPFAGSFLSSSNQNYTVELYGVAHSQDIITGEFESVGTMSYETASVLLSADKKVYAGARRTNWTGSVVQQSDIKVAAVSLYYDKLNNLSIQQHNLDPSNYGHNKTVGNPTIFTTDLNSATIPAQHSLVLHWDFQTVTSSNASGQFTVEDFSSGSSQGRYGWLGNIFASEHKGLGYSFPINSTKVVTNEFVFASKKQPPEASLNSDSVTIMTEGKQYLLEDEDVTDNIFMFEKSMYGSVSQKMLDMFSTIVEYSNLFMKPVDKYRQDYNRLNHAKSMFFEKVSGSMDLDRFTDYFKWIDDSVSDFLEQLNPVSSKFSKGIYDTIESHILERPKYRRKFPTIDQKTFSNQKIPTEGAIKGTNELQYNWRFGHAPFYKTHNDNTHCLWQKERREVREGPVDSREKLRSAYTTHTTGTVPYFGDNDRNIYYGSGYALKRFSKPYKLSVTEQKTIHGGINYARGKDRDILKTTIPVHGNVSSTGVPTDVVVLGVGAGHGITLSKTCEDDNQLPTAKTKYGTTAIVGKFSNFDGSSPISGSNLGNLSTAEYIYNLKGERIFPFNLISASVSTGYNKIVNENYEANAVLTNLHSDTTDRTNEIPMQGPFTEQWVGGRQSRHIPINRYKSTATTPNKLDHQLTRAEEWRLLFGEHPDEAVSDGALGITGPDYGGPYPDDNRKKAIHYRDGRTKRPVNIANIQYTTESANVGNYQHDYEIVSSTGRKENNVLFKDFVDSKDFLPTHIKNELPKTTNALSLFGINPGSTAGNVFGQGESNRINDIRTLLIPAFAGVKASGSFSLTGSTKFGFKNTGSFQVQPVPVAGLNPYISFTMAKSASMSDGDTLTITASGETMRLEIDGTGSTYEPDSDYIINTYRKAVRASGSISAQQWGDPAGNIGFGQGNWSCTLWFNNTNSDTSTSTYLGFYSGSVFTDIVYLINIDDDITFRVENVANTNDTANFNANTATTHGGDWIHLHFAYVGLDASPRFWLNGSEISSTGYSAIGGTPKDVQSFKMLLDDQMAMQDITFWNVSLTGADDVSALYNGGAWKSPTTHASSSNITQYYKFGEESSWYKDGYRVGDSFVDRGAAVERFFSSSFGTVSGARLDLGTSYDEDLVFIVGHGNLGAEEVWDNVSTVLNHKFTDWTTTYLSSSNYAQFFLHSGSEGPSGTIGATESGTSFNMIHTSTGSAQVVSTLANNDTLKVGSDVFTVVHNSSSVGVTNAITSSDNIPRKALKFATDGATGPTGLRNTNYLNPTSTTWLSISFWAKIDSISGNSWFFDSQDEAGGGDGSVRILRIDDDLSIYLYYNGVSSAESFDVSSVYDADDIGVWKHYVITWQRDIQATPRVYIDGALQSLTGFSSPSVSSVSAIEYILIGDKIDNTAHEEQNNGMHDFVLWNTGLDNTDAITLYNSGSWYDLYSHPSASYIWDWYLMGAETEIGQASGSALSSGTPVTELSPEIGRHSVDVVDNTDVFVTDGIHGKLSNTLFWSQVTSSIEGNTHFNSVSLSDTGLTASVIITAETTSSLSDQILQETGSTFSILTTVQTTTYPIGGAVDGNSFRYGTGLKYFLIDSDNSVVSSGQDFAEDNGNMYVNSSASSDVEFWNRVTAAYESWRDDDYQVTYTNYSDYARFHITASAVGVASNLGAFTGSGTSFTDLERVEGGLDSYSDSYETLYRNVSERITGSNQQKSIFTTRFSAPGGIEVQTYGYLDAYAQEYSVYNSLNYRNLSVRGSGSGEAGSIRARSQVGTRDGMRSLMQRHAKQGGIDSNFTSADGSDYENSASFHKIHRNTLVRPSILESGLVKERHDNFFVQSTLPRSDYNYSWVTASLGPSHAVRSGVQKVFGYWPKDGMLSSSAGFDSAITFPTASDIHGSI